MKSIRSWGGRGIGAGRVAFGCAARYFALVEGSTVFTSTHVKTDHILFIAPGRFPMEPVHPTDSRTAGRFPIRVELDDLEEEDFKRILTEPQNSLFCASTPLF
jgi:ATP-dependent HslUV protease ATP-binding subunit HslU